jgi:hypothetical protein
MYMQEDIEYRSVALVIKGANITAHTLAKAMRGALPKLRNRREKPGKTSYRKLAKGGKPEHIEISDGNIKAFDPIARKYGVKYALSKDASEQPPKWIVYFRTKDADDMTAAFREFSAKTLHRKADRPSVRAAMAKFKDAIKHAVIDRTKHKERSGPEL